jgi:hypothetical protein
MLLSTEGRPFWILILSSWPRSLKHVPWHKYIYIYIYIHVKWFCFEVKSSELSYSEVLWDRSTMCIRVTLYWGYLIVLWLFYLVCVLYCGCFNWFCNVWVCVCVGFSMCGYVYVWVCVCVVFVMCGCFGNMCTCIYCVFVLFLLCIFIVICY